MNIPFFFSTGLLLTALYFTYKLSASRLEDPTLRVFWKTLSVLIGLIVLDKFLHLHNKIRTIFNNILTVYEPTSPLYYVWTIPYLLLIGYIILRLKKSLLNLPFAVKKQLMLACVLLLTGGIFLEFAGLFYIYHLNGQSDIYHVLIKTAEELFQILGTVMLIYVLAKHFRAVEPGTA